MNKFTLIIHNKGWSVGDACKYWGIRYKTYNARCNSPKMFNQLESMCRGLPNKLVELCIESNSVFGELPFRNN